MYVSANCDERNEEKMRTEKMKQLEKSKCITLIVKYRKLIFILITSFFK